MNRPKLRETLLRVREEAITDVVNRLLAEKGYDSMTVDEVAANVGIAKASLYTHFASKEELAAAAMVRVLERAIAFTESAPVQAMSSSADRLRAVVNWTFDVQLAGEMPSLPAQNSTLRAVLMADKRYTGVLMRLSDILGGWIRHAQKAGDIDRELPAEVVLFTLYARACDPVLQVMKATGQYGNDEIKHLLTRSCFGGIGGSGTVRSTKQRKAA